MSVCQSTKRQASCLPSFKTVNKMKFAGCQEYYRSALLHRCFVLYQQKTRFSETSTSPSSSRTFRLTVLDYRPTPHSLQPLCADPLQRYYHIYKVTQFFRFFIWFQIIFCPPVLRSQMSFFTCFLHALFLGRPTLGLVGCAPFVHPCRQHRIKHR